MMHGQQNINLCNPTGLEIPVLLSTLENSFDFNRDDKEEVMWHVYEQ